MQPEAFITYDDTTDPVKLQALTDAETALKAAGFVIGARKKRTP